MPGTLAALSPARAAPARACFLSFDFGRHAISEERDSLKELQRYIGKKKKTLNSESFCEQASNAQCRIQTADCQYQITDNQ
jgi:hypothetical protein